MDPSKPSSIFEKEERMKKVGERRKHRRDPRKKKRREMRLLFISWLDSSLMKS